MTSEPFISPNRNRWMAYALTGVVAAMIGLAYAAVPLYQMFCKATGYGGTTQVATDNPKGIIDREMTVRFDSNVDSGINWTVTPAKPITEKIGSTETINFIAVNNSDKPTTGMAVFNVAPDAAGQYFNKIQCFCFTQQTLQPHERVEMPVVFFVDPDLAKNHDLDTTRAITLSYTFYAAKK
ncbi:MAG TPA: cytochrome c oxidase assembly protein [Devosiaceae bacterium]|jgi:cytochrome c oxidase assembly protein subunit 11